MGHLVQPSCRNRVTYSTLNRTLFRRVLNISREGDSTASLGSLFQCSITLSKEEWSSSSSCSDRASYASVCSHCALSCRWAPYSPYVVVNQVLLKNPFFLWYYCYFYNGSRMVQSCSKYQTPVMEGIVMRTDYIQDEMYISFCLRNTISLFKTKWKISKCGYHKKIFFVWLFNFYKIWKNKKQWCLTWCNKEELLANPAHKIIIG